MTTDKALHGWRGVQHVRRARQSTASSWLRGETARVYETNFGVYGARKVWLQLKREGITVARCTVQRLMRELGIQGVRRGKPH